MFLLRINIKIQRVEMEKISKSLCRLRPAGLHALILRTDKTLHSYCFALATEEIETKSHQALTK